MSNWHEIENFCTHRFVEQHRNQLESIIRFKRKQMNGYAAA